MGNAEHKLLWPQDAYIERSDNLGRVAVLWDSEGDRCWSFPIEWSDEQIMAALAFANHAYSAGVKFGSAQKSSEIRKALGVEQ